MKVTMTGWKPGVKTVSLIKAVMVYSDRGLIASKRLVDDLIMGESVSIEFESADKALAFKEVAQSLGAICEE